MYLTVCALGFIPTLVPLWYLVTWHFIHPLSPFSQKLRFMVLLTLTTKTESTFICLYVFVDMIIIYLQSYTLRISTFYIYTTHVLFESVFFLCTFFTFPWCSVHCNTNTGGEYTALCSQFVKYEFSCLPAVYTFRAHEMEWERRMNAPCISFEGVRNVIPNEICLISILYKTTEASHSSRSFCYRLFLVLPFQCSGDVIPMK